MLSCSSLAACGDPRELASAQAELAKRHGQRYVESVKQTIDVVADAWQEYGDRLATRDVTNKAQRATPFPRRLLNWADVRVAW
jgi:hypothetical protein